MRSGCLRSALLWSTFLGLSAVPVVVMAQDLVEYDIPAQALDASLTRIADQGGVRLFFTSDPVAGVRAKPVRGRMSVEAALTQALSGTGFSWRYREAGTVVIEKQPAPSTAIQLGTIRVEGAGGAAGGVTAGSGDTEAGREGAPYRTAGTSHYLSRERIQRFRGTSPGDFLAGTPGVLNGDNRNSGALDVNIRGMQGMDRVPVVVDGSLQQSTVYRGYAGVAGRTYLDPDLVGGVTIEKGPSAAADGVGATGGVVRVNTIGTRELIAPDKDFGFQVKVGLSGNNTNPPPVATPGTGQGGPERFDRPDDFSFGGTSLSIAGAKKFDRFDLVAAYAERHSGNYFGGKKGKVPGSGSRFGHEEEVLNTSQDNTSYLLRGVIRPTDEQALDLSYIRYESDFGELMPSQIIRYGGALQSPMSRTEVDTYTARYRYKPFDNDLIDLKLDGWLTQNFTNIVTIYRYNLPTGVLNQDEAYMSQSDRWGVNLSNTSRLYPAFGDLTLNYGLSYTNERLTPPDIWEDYKKNSEYSKFSEPRNGRRDEYSAFVAAELKPADWLTLNAALRYTDTYTEDYNMVTVNNIDAYYRDHTSGWAPIASVLIEPLAGLQFYARYAEAIRNPSLFETTTGFSFYPNPLDPTKPERAKNTEIGANYQKAALFTGDDLLSLKFGYFSNHVEDYLSRGPSDVASVTIVNLKSAEYQGIELSGRYDVGRVFAEFGGTLYTHKSFCDYEGVCRESGTTNSYVPMHLPPKASYNLTLGGRFLDEKLTLGARYVHVGKRDTSIYNWGGTLTSVEWIPYDVVDLFGSYRVNDILSVDFAVDNIGDKYYMDALTLGLVPSPGRTVRLGLTSRFNAPKETDSLYARRQAIEGFLSRNSGLGPFDGDWSGFRLGVHSGPGWLSLKNKTTAADGTSGPIPATESADLRADDAWLGLSAGYDWQFANRWVVGAEADVSWTRAKTSHYAYSIESTSTYFPIEERVQAGYEYEYDGQASVRARLGRSFGRTLVYGTAGASWLKESWTRTQYIDSASPNNLSDTQPVSPLTQISFTEKVDKTRTGWLLGGGAEVALSNRWSLKGEYTYTHYGKKDFLFREARSGVGKDYTTRVQTGTEWYNPADDPDMSWLCDIDPDWCTPYEQPVYEDVQRTGTSSITNGRRARSELGLHTLRLGLTYRF